MREGLVPGFDGHWTPARSPTCAWSRGCARAGTRSTQIKRASDSGQLAIGPIENLLRSSGAVHTLRRTPRARPGSKPS